MRPAYLLALFASSGCLGQAGVGEFESGVSVCAKGAVSSGIDVSHYDGTIDWTSVKSGGIDFAIMKATESTGFVDPTFATNWQGAAAAGVIRGAYHFFRASADPVQQADHFLATMGPSLPGDLPPTIDLETLDGLPAATAAQDALTFLQHVAQQTGRTPIVYTSARVMTELGDPSGFGGDTLWVANWQVTCPKIPSPEWSDWTFWQNSATGTVSGISGMVDLDQFNGTLADLTSYAGGGSSGGVDGGSGAPDGGSSGGGGGGGGGAGGDDGGSGGAGGGGGGGNGGGSTGGPSMHSGCGMAGPIGNGSFYAAIALALLVAWRRRRGHSLGCAAICPTATTS